MILQVLEARYISDYKIWLKFNNGSRGVVDLKDHLSGKVFEPLKNIDEFKKILITEGCKTLAWENGADKAPEFLYELLQQQSTTSKS